MITKQQKQPTTEGSGKVKTQFKSSKKLMACLLCLLVVGFGYGQTNLVPNFSFEQYDTCPEFGNQIQFAIGWSTVSEINTTPDYYNSCSASNSMGVPQNGFFYQPDNRNCGAYAGLVSWYYVGNNQREHIGMSLTQPLTIGEKYFISFKTVMGGTSDGFYYFDTPSNNMGMRLSTVEYDGNNPAPIDNFSHLHSASIISDTANWIRVSGSIIADSTYNFLMLGNFYDDSNTDTITMNCVNCTNTYSYYLIDDVCISTDSLYCNGGVDALPCNVSVTELNSDNDLSLFPNPASTFFNIRNDLNLTFDINVYDLYGQIILNKKNISSNDYQVDLSDYQNGIYIIDVSTKTNKYKFKLLKH